MWSMGRDDWGDSMLGLLGQGRFSLLLASESRGRTSSILGPWLLTLTLLAPHLSLVLPLLLKFLESWQDH